MDVSSLMFFVLAAAIVFFSLITILSPNPIYSAFFLSLTMVTLAFIFFLLKAFFIGGVQLIVYAGAVMVLFVMVLMLFDLNKELHAFSKGRFSNLIKIACAGWLCGLVVGAIYMSSEMLATSPSYRSGTNLAITTKDLAVMLFSDYLFAFEAMGLLLLVVAIGAVAISRIKGGTHAQS